MLREAVREKMGWLEAETGRTFGRGPRPLLVSVRSGAAQSMPGMLDTVLDLGINDASRRRSPSRTARDSPATHGAGFRRCTGASCWATPPARYPTTRMTSCAARSRRCSRRGTATAPWPIAATMAHDHVSGTAVVVQAMVFGNMERNSGTGVLFSRNPMTGADEPFGEWLPGGQGEDVVSGTFDVEPITRPARRAAARSTTN